METMETQDDLIPLPECARRLRVSWHVAWNLIQRGLLPARQLGGRWFATKVDLAEFLAGQGQPHTDAADSPSGVTQRQREFVEAAGRFGGALVASLPAAEPSAIKAGLDAGE